MPGLASSECSAGTPALRRARLEPRLQLCYVRHGSDGQSGLRWDALLRLAAYALADWSGFVCISRDADAHRTGAAIRARRCRRLGATACLGVQMMDELPM